MDTFDFASIIPNDAYLDDYLGKDWQVLLDMTRGDAAGVLHHFPSDYDQVGARTRTTYWELPIMLDTGTASYDDARRRLLHMNNNIDATKYVYVGDMQTFFRDTFYNVKFPDHFPNNVTVAAELHGRYHCLHATLRSHAVFIYNPIYMHFGVKGLIGDKLKMKMFSSLERWTFLIVAGTLQWLRDMFSEEELGNIKDILRFTKQNLPVYNHIGWLYYYATFVYGNLKAVRVGDHQRLDFLWEYSLMLYARTNKFIYKKGCLLNLKVLKDSEPNVRHILQKFRTYSEHGRPCLNGEIDMLRERVSAML